MLRVFRFAISGVSALALIVLVAVPESVWVSLPPTCSFRNIFHTECLGCGMTRALSAAVHGRFHDAMTLNAGVVIALPGLFAGALLPFWLRK